MNFINSTLFSKRGIAWIVGIAVAVLIGVPFFEGMYAGFTD